jgi:DnaB-like helicase C terminal domain
MPPTDVSFFDLDAVQSALAERGPFALLDALGVRYQREHRAARLSCPYHDERTPSATLAVGPEGSLRLHCHGACGRSWDALALLARVEGLDCERDFPAVLERAAGLAGIGPTPRGIGSTRRRLEPPPPEPPRYPTPAELAALWQATVDVTEHPPAEGALRARGIAPGLVRDLTLARALPSDGVVLPRWAAKAGRPWPEAGYAMVVPMWGLEEASAADRRPCLVGRSVRAWHLDPSPPEGTPKRVAPLGMTTAGLVMACPVARRLIAEGRPCRLVVVEGEPDFLSLATAAAVEGRAWGVLGVVAGSWTLAIAGLVPPRSVLAVATHNDAAGDRYAKAIADSAEGRFDVLRVPPPGPGDLNDMHRAGRLADFDPFAGAPAPGGLPPGESEGRDVLSAYLAQLRSPEGLPEPTSTGFRDLDDLLDGGFRPGELWVLAGRTSQGKSAAALSILAEHLARPGATAACLYSVEMTRNEMAARILSRQSGVPLSVLRRRGAVGEPEIAALLRAASPLAAPAWRLCDKRLTVEALSGRVTAYAAELRAMGGRLGLVVVDYVQRLVPTSARVSVREQIMHSSAELKALAMALGVPVVALAQVGREAEERENKRPCLRDLKETGALEEDADGVAFVYRPAVYDANADPGLAEIIVRKQRNGPVGTVHVRWRPELAAYQNETWADR